MAGLYYDRDRRNDNGRADYNGDFVPERIDICWCGDVACPVHDPAEAAAQEAERVARDTAAVIVAARMALDAWDVSEPVPPRIHRALADLSDALAKLDKLPF